VNVADDVDRPREQLPDQRLRHSCASFSEIRTGNAAHPLT
jgi:hypothetical protein